MGGTSLDKTGFIYTDHFTFSYLQVEKVLFWGQIFEVEILMDLHVLRFPESETTFLEFGLCVCVCVSVISIIQKQIVAENPNLVF